MIEKCEKQPYEEFPIGADFSLNFTTGEHIITQSLDVVDADGNDVADTITNTATLQNDGGARVYVLARGGTRASSPYKFTFRCVTSLGHKWELDVFLVVRER
jgi:hypothetical protein